jgi:hypothetical protein
MRCVAAVLEDAMCHDTESTTCSFFSVMTPPTSILNDEERLLKKPGKKMIKYCLVMPVPERKDA